MILPKAEMRKEFATKEKVRPKLPSCPKRGRERFKMREKRRIKMTVVKMTEKEETIRLIGE